MIYWRENEVQGQVSFLNVLLWQAAIWIPWTLFFLVFKKIVYTSKLSKGIILGLGFLWVAVHYIWFFFLSSHFSPYLGLPATGYGVYPYFFIFWILADLVLMLFLLDVFHRQKQEFNKTKPFVFELSRGSSTYYFNPEQIHWLSADGYYTVFHTVQGAFLIRRTLKDIIKKLPQIDFKRIHRSTVINVNYVSGLGKTKNNSLEVILKDASRCRVSRSYSKEIRSFFKDRSI